MKIKRFGAKEMRTALTQIKEELGADAVIMSNKKIPEGVELMAAVDYSQSVEPAKQPNETMSAQVVNQTAEKATEQVNNQVTTARMTNREISHDVVNIGQSTSATSREPSFSQPLHNQESNTPVDSLSALLNRQVQHQASGQKNTGQAEQLQASQHNEASIEQQLKSFTERLQQTVSGDSTNHLDNNASSVYSGNNVLEQAKNDNITANLTISNEVTNESITSQNFANMQQEMASIRSLLEHQVSGLMWQDMAQKDPQRAVLVKRLTALGLNEQIADQIAGYVPQQAHEQEAWSHATKLITQQINTTQNDIINRGGVVALVGPTGVGKTTTIAKLAAGYAQVHGADQVALISTDTFRIAGFEQLATYGKIIGCQVVLAKDSEALDVFLQQFSKKKLVLIDTAGMGQRDMRLAEQLTALVANSRVRIRNYLVLAANVQQRVMQENVDRFKKIPLSGCIYTKLDESVSIGEIITTSIQNGLPIGYLTDGQRVPEDIKVANAEKLVTLADKMASRLVDSHIGGNMNSSRPVAPSAAL